MADVMQQECKSLLLQLRLKQKNLKHLIPPDTSVATARSSCDTSIVSDTYSENIDQQSPHLKASYARNKLKSFIRSPRDSLSLSVDENTSLDSSSTSSSRRSYKPQVFLHDTSLTKPKPYNKSSVRSASLADTALDTNYRTNGREISANFLRDINKYFDDSKDVTLESVKTADFDDQVSPGSVTPPRWASEKYSSLPSTPNTVQRRNMIDKNIPVTSKFKDLNLNSVSSRLNFSYSTVDDEEDLITRSGIGLKDTIEDTDQTFLKSGLNASPEDIFLKEDVDYRTERKHRERMKEREREHQHARKEKEMQLYNKHLEDYGNSKTQLSMAREASIPRSILSSPGSRTSTRSKAPSKVSFHSSMLSTSLNSTQQNTEAPASSRMLGYDWIAALLDNETGCLDESESYFNDLKEFRRSNRDECCNNFYMNNPLTFAEPKESTIVEQALSEPKVKPYIVNDRLFTQPMKKKLIDDLTDDEQDESSPSRNNPRYVRVSIPRSTLEQPYKMKPHRRNSFDPTDSCALREHCLMGWENSRVSSLPTASSVDINEATVGPKPKMVTTLAEAEQIARSGTTQMWPFIPPPPQPDHLPSWRKNYEESVMNMSRPCSMGDSVTTNDSDSVRKSTNNLLNSTYSLMYEMKRLKKERESTKA